MSRRWNVIVVVTDDQPVGDIAEMPYLNSRPHGHWVTFPHATLHTPWCGPSRANIFTGLAASRTGVKTNETTHLLEQFGSLAVPLKAAGYHNGMFGKYENLYPAYGGVTDPFGRVYKPPGWHKWAAHRIASGQYYNYRMIEDNQQSDYGSSEADYVTDVLNGKAVSFIETAREPFFAYVAHWSPHEAEIPAPRHVDLYPDAEWTPPPSFNEADISDKPSWLQAHQPTQRDAATVADLKARRVNTWRTLRSVDEGLNDMLDACQARGILDRTVVIFLSDNGVMWGEHRLKSKGYPYEENVRTDMLVRWPGATQRDDPALVQNIDIAPTICDLAGTSMPWVPDGMSMRPVIEERVQPENWRAGQVLEWHSGSTPPAPPWRALRTTTAKYVEHQGGDRELYDLVADPYEMTNLAGTGDPRQAELAAQLAAIEQGPLAPAV